MDTTEMSPWTDAVIAEMCRLWNAGLSASKIADELNAFIGKPGYFSRSAILGKRKRITGVATRRMVRFGRPHDLWTHSRVAALRELWSTKLTHQQIADKLNEGVLADDYRITRNSVLAKGHKMGLPSRQVEKPIPVEKPKRHGGRLNPTGRKPLPYVIPPAPLPVQRNPVNAPVDLITAHDAHTCLWPVNNGRPYLFCGKARAGASYCEAHQRKSVALHQPERAR